MTFTDDELRMLSLCAPTLLKMLEAREDKIISRMYGEFRNGKTEHLTSLAELACVKDQIHEITSALTRLQKGN